MYDKIHYKLKKNIKKKILALTFNINDWWIDYHILENGFNTKPFDYYIFCISSSLPKTITKNENKSMKGVSSNKRDLTHT